MVSLTRITTRTGDDGSTGLADGSRLPKDAPLIDAIGAVDEANAILGLVRLDPLPEGMDAALAGIQNDLFDLGADLATPSGVSWEARVPRIVVGQVARLEALASAANAGLPALTSFILPGGTPAGARLHHARTVVRRAERALVTAIHADPGRTWNPSLVHYLNRLSDLLFIWSRRANGDGTQDVLWKPGAGRD